MNIYTQPRTGQTTGSTPIQGTRPQTSYYESILHSK